MTRLALLAVLGSAPVGCADSEQPGDEGAATTDGGSSAASVGSDAEDTAATDGSGDGAASTSDGTLPTPEDGVVFMDRLPGLWVAPVDSETSVGDFAAMNMDVRAADGHVLFSRVDLDTNNNLRFAFAYEVHDGEPVLVFRNGGYFMGILRDTRNVLVEADVEAERWRFCAMVGGCDYVDAVFDFEGDGTMNLDVNVRNMKHFHWGANRAESRELGGPVAGPDDPQPGDAEFPPMPSLRVELSWPQPLGVDTSAWVILSTTDCTLAVGSCTPSRFISVRARAGSTDAQVVLDQIHGGAYKANAVLDHNGNLGTFLFPDLGDGISIPNQGIDVADVGETQVELVIGIEL